jgi:hypothetical protein
MNTLKYLSIGIIFTVFGYILGMKLMPIMLNLQNKIKRMANIRKYHIHHDLGGIFLMIVALTLSPLWLQIAVMGLGLGLFIHHITTDGIRLITKD